MTSGGQPPASSDDGGPCVGDSAGDGDGDNDNEQVDFDYRRMLLQTLIGAAVVVAVAGVAGLLLYDTLVTLGNLFVEKLGGPGVFVAFVITDGLGVPVPPDTFAMFALTGGMPYPTVVLWGSIGSICGGVVGYTVGRKLGQTRRMDRLASRKRGQIDALVDRYGALAIAIAALTPLPYPFAAWAAGATRMELRVFLLVSLLRIPRVAGYLLLIEFGLVTLRG